MNTHAPNLPKAPVYIVTVFTDCVIGMFTKCSLYS